MSQNVPIYPVLTWKYIPNTGHVAHGHGSRTYTIDFVRSVLTANIGTARWRFEADDLELLFRAAQDDHDSITKLLAKPSDPVEEKRPYHFSNGVTHLTSNPVMMTPLEVEKANARPLTLCDDAWKWMPSDLSGKAWHPLLEKAAPSAQPPQAPTTLSELQVRVGTLCGLVPRAQTELYLALASYVGTKGDGHLQKALGLLEAMREELMELEG